MLVREQYIKMKNSETAKTNAVYLNVEYIIPCLYGVTNFFVYFRVHFWYFSFHHTDKSRINLYRHQQTNHNMYISNTEYNMRSQAYIVPYIDILSIYVYETVYVISCN